jgi:hypothetical protein
MVYPARSFALWDLIREHLFVIDVEELVIEKRRHVSLVVQDRDEIHAKQQVVPATELRRMSIKLQQ